MRVPAFHSECDVALSNLAVTPIRYEFSAADDRVARSGYESYFRNRPGTDAWESLPGHRSFRWRLAAHVLNHTSGNVSPEVVRAVYFVGYYTKTWRQLKKLDRTRWYRVTDAMLMARAGKVTTIPRRALTIRYDGYQTPTNVTKLRGRLAAQRTGVR